MGRVEAPLALTGHGWSLHGIADPPREELTLPIQEQLIVELYSR